MTNTNLKRAFAQKMAFSPEPNLRKPNWLFTIDTITPVVLVMICKENGLIHDLQAIETMIYKG